MRGLLYCCLLLALAVPTASAQGTVAVQYLLAAINQERASRGIAPVHLDAALTQAALEHARLMADRGEISHRFSDEPDLSVRVGAAGARFDRVTENVGEGPSAVNLHDAWMHSAGHRANILDPAVDAVGIAIVVRNGQMYAVQDFERSITDLTLVQQEATVGVLLDQAGLEMLPNEDARRTCAMASGFAGEERPSYVFRYTTADLSRLPSQLKARLTQGREHHAAVGACHPPPAADGNGFSSYSIAVVLYP